MENINKDLNCSVSEEPAIEQEIYGQQKLIKLVEIKKNINWMYGFRHGLGEFHVKQGRKPLYGLLNAAGEIVLEPQPKTLSVIDENTVALYNSGNYKHKVLDLKSNNIYTYEHYWAQIYGNVKTTRYGKKGVIDINGNIMIPHRYRHLWRRADIISFIAHNCKNKCGLLDSCGKELIPFEYDDLSSEYHDRFSVRQGKYWFVIDRSGQRLSKKRYDCLGGFTESGYAIFGKTTADDGWPKGKRIRYGVIDKDERIIIPAVFDSLFWFGRNDDRLSCGKTDRWKGWPIGPSRKYGVIDSRGNMIIPPSYHNVLSQGPDRTYVAYSNNEGSDNGMFQGVIDEEGRIVVPFRDWQIKSMGGAYRIYDRQIDRFGLYSSSGEELLPFEFDYIDVGDSLDYIAVCKGGEWYYVNQHGERVLL